MLPICNICIWSTRQHGKEWFPGQPGMPFCDSFISCCAYSARFLRATSIAAVPSLFPLRNQILIWIAQHEFGDSVVRFPYIAEIMVTFVWWVSSHWSQNNRETKLCRISLQQSQLTGYYIHVITQGWQHVAMILKQICFSLLSYVSYYVHSLWMCFCNCMTKTPIFKICFCLLHRKSKQYTPSYFTFWYPPEN